MTCLIIGFCYSDEDTLMSSSVDMFSVYKIFSSRGLSTIVLSDITQHPESILRRMDMGKVDDDIYSFVPNPPTGRHYLGGLKWNIVRSKDDLLRSISSFDSFNDKKLVIYFTGHSEEGGMILLPNSENISSVELTDRLLSKCGDVEILSIFDACYVGNIRYPYKLINNSFSLEDRTKLITSTVIHLSSSDNSGISESDNSNSLFTKYLMRGISSGIIHIPTLLKRVQEKIDKKSGGDRRQTIMCFSSMSIPPVLYSWVLPTGVSLSYCNGILTIEL